MTTPSYDPVFQQGITYAIEQLAAVTAAKDWQIRDGSESVEGDVRDTILDVLKCAGLYDDETGKFAMRRPTQAEIADSEARNRKAWGHEPLTDTRPEGS